MHRSPTLALLGSLAMPFAGEAREIYVSNEKGNTVTIIDGEKLKVTATIPVGNRPRGIVLSPDGRHLYVCASDDDTILVMDTTTHEILGRLPSGPDPEVMALSPDGTLMYVANEDDNMVTVIDIPGGQVLSEIPVGVEPEGLGVSHDGKWAVNTSETTNMAHFIDTDTHEITDNVLVDQRPRFAEWTSDDAEVWVSAEIGGTVSVIDGATRQIKHKIGFAIPGVPTEAIQPVGVRVSKDRKWAFVALGPSNRVAVVNAQTFAVEKYLLVGQRVWQLAFSPDEKFVYSTNGVSNDISVIDVENLEVIKSVTTGAYPWVWQSRIEAAYELTAGKYYRIAIPSDGSAKLAVAGLELFRDMWVDEVVINDIAVRPLGVDSIELGAPPALILRRATLARISHRK